MVSSCGSWLPINSRSERSRFMVISINTWGTCAMCRLPVSVGEGILHGLWNKIWRWISCLPWWVIGPQWLRNWTKHGSINLILCLEFEGDPLRYHSHFTASVITSPNTTIRPMEFVAHGRLGTATKKAHLLCTWSEDTQEVEVYSLEWSGLGWFSDISTNNCTPNHLACIKGWDFKVPVGP